MTNQQQKQCLSALDTINLVRNYLEMASKLEKTDVSYPDEFLLEEAARQLAKSQDTLHDIVFDDETDEDREKEQGLTPEQKAKREERSVMEKKESNALKAVRDLLFEEPDSVVQFAEAFREDPSRVKDLLGEKPSTVDRGITVEQCLETIHVKDGSWWLESESGESSRKELTPDQARTWLEEHGCTDALKEFGFEGGGVHHEQ